MTDKEKKDSAEATETVEVEEAEHHHHHHHHDHEHDEEVQFVEDPTFDVDYKGDCAYEVKVTIPVANEEHQTEELLDEISTETQLPGFRRGKAPRKLVEKKFSKYVKGEVASKLVSAAFRKLVEKEELHPIALPEIDGLDAEEERAEDAPLEVTLKFEVAPRVKLGAYEDIKVERPVLKVEDADIEAALQDVRERFSVYETLEGGVATEGDQVIIDFKGMVDGEAFAGGSADNYPYILGSNRFLPEFEKGLLGASAGDDLKIDVTFPKDYAEALRGKAAVFEVKVNEVKRRTVPEFNDDFAKQAGYESAAKMREAIAERLRKGAEERSDSIARDRAIEALVERSEFELPKTMVEDSAKEYYEQERRRLMALRQPASEIEAKDEEIRTKAHDNAVRNIKAYVVVNEIGKSMGIEVTDEDWEKEATAISERSGAELDLVAKYLAQDEQRNSYESRIFRAKATAALMSHVTVKDKEVTREELDKQDDESAE